MRIAICIITFQRPAGLARTLEGLDALELQQPVPQARIIVVDNDAARSAERVCSAFTSTHGWPLDYHVQAQRGISYARNTALKAALPTADWIAFLDDDEAPRPHWLHELLQAQRRFDADVVTGPVISQFRQPPATWIIKGRFFDRRRHPTGRQLSHAFTNNVLFRADIVRNHALEFDPRFALVGGGDRHFFRRVGRLGYRIVWADEAEVVEWVPVKRGTAAWIVQRLFRVGNSTALVEMDLERSLRTRAVLAAKAAAWLVIGVLLLPAAVLGRRHSVRALRAGAYGLGMFWGLAGGRYEEYRTPVGD